MQHSSIDFSKVFLMNKEINDFNPTRGLWEDAKNLDALRLWQSMPTEPLARVHNFHDIDLTLTGWSVESSIFFHTEVISSLSIKSYICWWYDRATDYTNLKQRHQTSSKLPWQCS